MTFIRNRARWSTIAAYFFYLAPQLIYVIAPISVLVAVLVTFGLLTKRNEFTAMKACGVSLYRASLSVFAGGSRPQRHPVAFDHFYLPSANKKQEALRSHIKGRPPQTYYRPDRKWIFGQQSRIFYYNFFEPGTKRDGRCQHLGAATRRAFNCGDGFGLSALTGSRDWATGSSRTVGCARRMARR